MSVNKAELRRHVLELRETALTDSEKGEKGSRVSSQLINDFLLPASVKSLGLYYPIRNEVDTFQVFEFCLRKGIECFFPRVVSGTDMQFYPVKSRKELVKRNFGIYEPDVGLGSGEGHGTPEILVIPGIAFDRNNNRLGYGKGYYDSYLKEHRPFLTVGFAYEFQIIDEIPADDWDARMDLVLTEKGWHGDFKNIAAGGPK